MQKIGTFFDRRYNAYVPGAQYACDAVHSAPYKVMFNAPPAAAPAAILSLQSIAVATNNVALGVALLADTNVLPFGRNLTFVASGVAVTTVTVTGKDYLGQPVVETITLNGAAQVVGLKAFKWIDRIAWGATAATTISVGFGARLGLPYRASNVLDEVADGTDAVVGTLFAPVSIDPATAITGDTRGTYTPTTALNGVAIIEATFLFNNALNAAGNGGLYGIRHFVA